MRIVKNLKKWIIDDSIVGLYNGNSFSPIFLDKENADLIYDNKGKNINIEDKNFEKLLKDNFIILNPLLNNKKHIHKQYIKRLGESSNLNIRFMASYECNQNCEYCMTRFAKEKIKGYFNKDWLDNFSLIINAFINHSPFKKIDSVNVKLIGGEPTMPKAWEINKAFLTKINSIFDNCEHTIVTNGDYINDAILEEFKVFNIKYIYLSFDIRKNKNDDNGSNLRNELSLFEKKCEMIEKHGIGIKIDFKCDEKTTLSDEIINFINKRLEKENNLILNSPIVEQDQYDVLVNPQCDKYDILSKHSNKIYDISKSFFDLNNNHGSWPNTLSSMVYRCNAATLTNICIYPNGLVSGCGKLYSSDIDKVPVVADFKTGYVNKKQLLNFKKNVLKDKECKHCEYTFICGGKCPLKKSKKCDKEKIGTELLLEAYKYTICSSNKKISS